MDKFKFFGWADNLKGSTIVSTHKKRFKFFMKIGLKVENLC